MTSTSKKVRGAQPTGHSTHFTSPPPTPIGSTPEGRSGVGALAHHFARGTRGGEAVGEHAPFASARFSLCLPTGAG